MTSPHVRIGIHACVVAVAGAAWGQSPPPPLQRLVEGNARYVAEARQNPRADEPRRCQTFSEGQNPFAIVLSCADSRVPVEILFDQGVGDLFVIRVAGNVAQPAEMASIEYAAAHLGAPLVVVMGHSRCGAVAAAVEGGHAPGHLPQLLHSIAPAVETVRRTAPDLTGAALLDATVQANAWLSVETLLTRSGIVADLVRERRLQVVAAVYDIHSGEVQFLGSHPAESDLLTAGPRSHAGHDAAGAGGHGANGGSVPAATRPSAHATPDRPATPPSPAHGAHGIAPAPADTGGASHGDGGHAPASHADPGADAGHPGGEHDSSAPPAPAATPGKRDNLLLFGAVLGGATLASTLTLTLLAKRRG